jgi:uncharacterized protein DUF6166
MKTYTGSRPEKAVGTEPGPVFVERRRPLDPQINRWRRSHLNWGYSGSEPQQLACVLLEDAVGADAVNELAGQFVDDVIRHLPDTWSLTADSIRQWAREELARRHSRAA